MKTPHAKQIFITRTLLLTICMSSLFLSVANAASDAKQEALAWIDSYRKVQVMFHDKDIERVRQKISVATPEKAAEWLKQTEKLRKALDSPDWKKTQTWFKEFLKVQAIYSDEQVEEFRKKAAKSAEESPAELMKLLADLESKRKATVGGSASSADLRKQQISINQAYQQQQVAERDKIRQAKATAMADADLGPGPQVKGRDYRRPPALIDSMDVARWSVMRNFLPRW